MKMVWTGVLLGGLACLAAPPARKGKAKAAPAQAGPAIPEALANGELVDPQGGRPLPMPAPRTARQDFQLTALADGRVLLTGGTDRTTSEILAPGAQAWVPGPTQLQARTGHRAVRLVDGRVLLLGGTEPAAPAEVLDPVSGKAEKVEGAGPFGLSSEAVVLKDGRVLMVDGATGRTWSWQSGKSASSAGTLAYPRVLFRLTALPDGGALVTGGFPAGAKGRESLAAERMGSSLRRWSTLRTPLAPRARHQATLLSDGRLLLWGGHGMDPQKGTSALEILDLGREKVEANGTLNPAWGILPGLANRFEAGLTLVADQSARAHQIPGPDALPAALKAAPLQVMANGFLEPQAVVCGPRVLVMGSAQSGPTVERWEARLKASQTLGTLRAGSEGLAVLKDKRVVSLGPVVDLVDLRTGALRPLGWRDDLTALLKTSLPLEAEPQVPGRPREEGRRSLRLDARRVLEAGNRPEIEVVEGKKVTPVGKLSTPRNFQRGGGLVKASDGTVLIWGGEVK